MNARHLATGLERAAAQQFASAHSEYVPQKPSPSNPVRVLIVGDHPTLRSSLRTLLELDPAIRIVGEAADDCETVKMAHRLRPDVVLVDLDMHCCDNYEALAEISQRSLASSIVGLTIHDDQVERTAAQAAGVNLFLEKGVPYKQLISAIRLAAVNSLNH